MTVRISDHAVIRYLERHYGFDFEKVRSEMMSPALETADAFGATFILSRGGKMVLREGVVVTFVPNQKRKGPRHGRHW